MAWSDYFRESTKAKRETLVCINKLNRATPSRDLTVWVMQLVTFRSPGLEPLPHSP